MRRDGKGGGRGKVGGGGAKTVKLNQFDRGDQFGECYCILALSRKNGVRQSLPEYNSLSVSGSHSSRWVAVSVSRAQSVERITVHSWNILRSHSHTLMFPYHHSHTLMFPFSHSHTLVFPFPNSREELFRGHGHRRGIMQNWLVHITSHS